MKYTKAQAIKILKYHTILSDFKDLFLYKNEWYKVLKSGLIVEVGWAESDLDYLEGGTIERGPTEQELKKAYKKQLAKEKKNG